MVTDREGLREYSEAVLRELYRVAREEKRGRHDAIRTSDLVQDIFLRIEPKWRDGDPLEALVPLAATVARHLLIDYWRRGKPQLVPPEHFEDATRACRTFGIDPIDFQDYVAELDERDRRVLDLRVFAGYSQEEIATALDETVYFVSGSLRRAESRLRVLENDDS